MSAVLPLSDAEFEELRSMLHRWRWDPVAFVLEVFGPGYEARTRTPLQIDRWQEKALREAKRATSWDRPDEAFEAEAQGLARFILTAPEGADMRREIEHELPRETKQTKRKESHRWAEMKRRL